MAKEPTKPLIVTAKLFDGRLNSSDGIIMFDAILYHAWFAKHHPEVYETGKWMNHGSGFVGLPLRQLPGNRWAASKGIYTEISQEIEHWNKRPNFFNPDKSKFLEQKKGAISDSVGSYRAYRTPNVTRILSDATIEFYCVGHADEIIDLLSHIPGIGKKNSMGWGHVVEWSAEETDKDYSLMHPGYGLMRPTPIEELATPPIKPEGGGYPIMEYAVKPPYWKQQNKRLCYVPC